MVWLAAGLFPAWASEPVADLLTLDRVVYELAVLDAIAAEPVDPAPVDPVFKGGFEWVPPFNPCAHLPPDEPSAICRCPPMPPWGNCL